MNSGTLTLWAPTLLLVVARIGGLFIAAPVLSHPSIPGRLRYFMSVVIALGMLASVGVVAQPLPVPGSWAALLRAGVLELAVGAAIGFAASLVFVGVELGAMHVGQQMGLALAEVYAPEGNGEGGAVRTLFMLTALVLFLAIGGHRQMIAAVAGSFQTVPLAGLEVGEALPAMVAGLLQASFILAIKVAAPALVAMLLATVAMGLLQKTAPQFNILSTELPIRGLVGLIVLTVTIAALPALVEAAWKHTMRVLPAILDASR